MIVFHIFGKEKLMSDNIIFCRYINKLLIICELRVNTGYQILFIVLYILNEIRNFETEYFKTQKQGNKLNYIYVSSPSTYLQIMLNSQSLALSGYIGKK